MAIKFFAIFSVTFLLAIGGCASFQTQQPQMTTRALDDVPLGTSEADINKRFGQASHVSNDYGPLSLRLIEYSKQDSSPNFQFAFDSQKGELVEKAIWLYPGDHLYDATQLELQLHGVALKSYMPCRTRSEKDSIRADEMSGLYVEIENGHPVFVSWSKPEIVKLRVDHLYKTCPRRQPKR